MTNEIQVLDQAYHTGYVQVMLDEPETLFLAIKNLLARYQL